MIFLDILRGWFAIAIAVYHYLSWSNSTLYDLPIVKLCGVYGVSCFFVLSGFLFFTLYDYDRLFISMASLTNFFVKRFARVYPLYLIVTIVFIIILAAREPTHIRIIPFIRSIIPLLLLFDPSSAIAQGSWSVVVEIYFYISLPFILALKKLSQIAVYLLLGYFLSLRLSSLLDINIFDFNVNDSSWSSYTQLRTQFFCFVCPLATMRILDSFRKPSSDIYPQPVKTFLVASLSLIFLVLVAFSALYDHQYPYYTAAIIDIFLIFSISMAITCLATFKSVYLPLRDFQVSCGTYSYSIYLLHPLVYQAIHKSSLKLNIAIPPILFLCIFASLTYIASRLSYIFIEQNFQHRLHRLAGIDR
jgi:exopolysaccharide production protein ExoZ